TLYFDSLTVNAGNGGFLHCIQMDTSVNAANQVVSVGADIAFDADPKFFACLVRFESSSVPSTLPIAYYVFFFDCRCVCGLFVFVLLLMLTLYFLSVWFCLSLLRFRLPSRLPMMFILWMVAMMVVIIPSRTV